MTRKKILEKLNMIFQNNFDNEHINLTEETVSTDIDGWDSIEQINLIVIIQEEFQVRFNIDEVNSMKTIGEIIDFIIKKIN